MNIVFNKKIALAEALPSESKSFMKQGVALGINYLKQELGNEKFISVDDFYNKIGGIALTHVGDFHYNSTYQNLGEYAVLFFYLTYIAKNLESEDKNFISFKKRYTSRFESIRNKCSKIKNDVENLENSLVAIMGGNKSITEWLSVLNLSDAEKEDYNNLSKMLKPELMGFLKRLSSFSGYQYYLNEYSEGLHKSWPLFLKLYNDVYSGYGEKCGIKAYRNNSFQKIAFDEPTPVASEGENTSGFKGKMEDKGVFGDKANVQNQGSQEAPNLSSACEFLNSFSPTNENIFAVKNMANTTIDYALKLAYETESNHKNMATAKDYILGQVNKLSGNNRSKLFNVLWILFSLSNPSGR